MIDVFLGVLLALVCLAAVVVALGLCVGRSRPNRDVAVNRPGMADCLDDGPLSAQEKAQLASLGPAQ